MSATTAAAAAAASGGGCGGEGGAFTGVVDSGVSNASSESELLGKIKGESSEQSEDSCLQVYLEMQGFLSWGHWPQLPGYLCVSQRTFYIVVWFPEQNTMAMVFSICKSLCHLRLLCVTKANTHLEINLSCRSGFPVWRWLNHTDTTTDISVLVSETALGTSVARSAKKK